MGTKESLECAKALIDTPRKWCRDKLSGCGGRRCAVQAIRDTNIGQHDRLESLVLLAAREVDYDATDSLGDWNDAHSHTQLMEAFDFAIAHWDLLDKN